MALRNRFLSIWGILCASFFCEAQLPDSSVRPSFPLQYTPSIGGSFSCGMDALMTESRQSADFRKREEMMNMEILSSIRLFSNDTVILPVVFHVLSENPDATPDQALIEALADLNDAFAKRGRWSGSKGVDTRIRFCLARRDPEGGNATGINRVKTTWGINVNAQIEDAKMKANAQWDPARFINVWYVPSLQIEGIVEFLCGVWSRGRVGGYATMPPGGGPTDGVVVTGFGLLLAHEMGHYLGLYHTYERGCANNDCTRDGDRVCDTQPDQSYKFSPCPNPENSCNTDTLSNYSNGYFRKDVPDPVDNIMDYGDANCQFTFTQGQADRMHAAINTQRKGLLEYKCEVLCSENVYALFDRDIRDVVFGDSVNFTNKSVGGITYQWFVDGQPVATTQNFYYKFNRQGRIKITLRAIRNNHCYSSYSQWIVINCGVWARFYTNKHLIASKETIYEDTIKFTNNSLGGKDFKWIVSNDRGLAPHIYSTNRDIDYRFLTPANYTFQLIASNGACIDTTLPFRINVLDPTPDGDVHLTAVHCFEQTKIRAEFFVCNNSFDTIPANTPISFYDADPRRPGAKKIGETFLLPVQVLGSCCTQIFSTLLDVGAPGLNTLFISFNDAGQTLPVVFPVTNLIEKNYDNNVKEARNFQFRVIPVPASAVMEPGDTLFLGAFGTPTFIPPNGFRWGDATRLNCTNCATPRYIADTTRRTTKMVYGTSMYGCYDSAQLTITVPPYHDFRVTIDEAECDGTDSIRVKFTLYNDFKRPLLPKGLTTRFYSGDPSTANARQLGTSFILPDTIVAGQLTFTFKLPAMPNGRLFAAVNDSLGMPPLRWPNTWLEEKNYTNNLGSYDYQRLRVVATPLVGAIEPGDTLHLEASAAPGIIKSYTWSPAYNLSCSVCPNPEMITDTTTTKWVIAENNYGCRDTAFLPVNIPPANDFRISIEETACAANDSMFVRFNIYNDFRRGYLPRGLTIRFYDADPRQNGARELMPAFMLPQNLLVREQSFNTRIQNSNSGQIFMVVNDSGTTRPLVLPNSLRLEKDYTNNIVSSNYRPETLLLSPQDTSIIRGGRFTASILNTLDNPGSTRWQTGTIWQIDCPTCTSAEISSRFPASIRVTSVNRYGCILSGTLNLQIISPDFTLRINETECINNRTTKAKFTICMNNNYDTVWREIPVTFFDGDPLQGGKPLSFTYVTPSAVPGNCMDYEHSFQTPMSNNLFAIVNNDGTQQSGAPAFILPEANTGNNIIQVSSFRRFNVITNPVDTTIERSSSVPVFTFSEGGNLNTVRWDPSPFLSCTNCANQVITPNYTERYMVTGFNENQCSDTAFVIVRTVTIQDMQIPNAFTPNGDGLNDIFYVMASEKVARIEVFRIFNRYGEVVFESQNFPPNDPKYGWDGKVKGQIALTNAFVYQVSAEFTDGKKQSYKGTVTVVR